jgi:3-hydroxymyristoyl/3-hydroxydecanoyl-(acyl carrier protein) dehydratase
VSVGQAVDHEGLIHELRRFSGSNDRLPRVLSVAEESASATVQLGVSPDLHWFRGHFPDRPILPGIVQVDWAVMICRAVFGHLNAPCEIRRLKFRSMIAPGEDVELTIRRKGDHQVGFWYVGAGETKSEGTLVFPEGA